MPPLSGPGMETRAEPKNEALCVRVLWGERRVATHLLHPGDAVSLTATGERAKVGEPALSFEVGTRHFGVGFHEGVVGTLLRNGETPLSLGEVVHRGLAMESPAGWNVDLGRADVLRLGGGPVQLEAFRVRAPARAVGALELDYRFLNTLMVCIALFLGLVVQAQLMEDELEESDATSTELTRMRHVLVRSEPPKPQKRATEVTANEPMKQPRKGPPAEGRPRSPDRPQRNTGGAAVPTATDLARSVFGGPGTRGVLGPGGFGDELRGALGGVVAANGDGMGGWGLRGNGAGGPGGNPEQIGSIALSGTAKRSGIGRLCGGPGPCKQSVAPTIDDTQIFGCASDGVGAVCMDKDLIRKVIASHRDQVRFCYELALQEAPSLAGKVAVFFAVSQSGAVAAARIDQNTAGSQKLGECLVSRVTSWQFPVGRGSGGYRVTYPFVFKPAGN